MKSAIIRLLCVCVVIAGLSSAVSAAWFDSAWPVRRAVDVEFDPEKVVGIELVDISILTAGYQEKSGENVRVATEDGKLVSSRVLMLGPGDSMRVLFAPQPGVKRHYIYFGHPKPPPAPRGSGDVPIKSGVLMEMHRLVGGPANDFAQMDAAWQRSTQVMGRKMLPQLYLGFNPFGDYAQIITRYSATLYLPADGAYIFAGSASDKGALYIDGKPVLFVPGLAGDVRHQAKVELKKGPRQLQFFHLNAAGDQRVSLVWKPPDKNAFELIAPNSFGPMLKATAGVLEEGSRPITADVKIEYLGELFYADHYSHRYRFTAQGARGSGAAGPKYEWDFGDGQTATGPTAEHVFFTDGVYSIKLSAKNLLQTDTKTNRIIVSRLYERIDNPPGDSAEHQAKIAAAYDFAKMPPRWLVWATLLFHRANLPDPLEKCAIRLATQRDNADPALVSSTLAAASNQLCAETRFDAASRLWQSVTPDSPYQPFAAKQHAAVLLWRLADFPAAVKLLEPHVKARPEDVTLKRLYAIALTLNQQPDGIKILKDLKPEGPLDRQAALTGALARTIEYYITENDYESGEAHWDKWLQQYPADFLEGYSVMLRSRLMETAKAPMAAAKVAEAFALAMPKSSYAPRLLDRASKLLAGSDAVKSKALRELLKQKYPEDPLSQ